MSNCLICGDRTDHLLVTPVGTLYVCQVCVDRLTCGAEGGLRDAAESNGVGRLAEPETRRSRREVPA